MCSWISNQGYHEPPTLDKAFWCYPFQRSYASRREAYTSTPNPKTINSSLTLHPSLLTRIISNLPKKNKCWPCSKSIRWYGGYQTLQKNCFDLIVIVVILTALPFPCREGAKKASKCKMIRDSSRHHLRRGGSNHHLEYGAVSFNWDMLGHRYIVYIIDPYSLFAGHPLWLQHLFFQPLWTNLSAVVAMIRAPQAEWCCLQWIHLYQRKFDLTTKYIWPLTNLQTSCLQAASIRLFYIFKDWWAFHP